MAVGASTGTQLPRARRARVEDWSRWALLAAWLVIAATVAVAGERWSTLGDLEAALAEDRVETVVVAGSLGPGAEGYATVGVHWRDGPVRRWTEVLEASPGTAAPTATDHVTAVRYGDVGQELAERWGVSVERVEAASSWGEVFGWRVPPWTGLLVLGTGAGALCLLVGGPQPWRATRWAWFWIITTPPGVLLFLLLSGPTRPLPPPRDPARRLTGGWALLVCLLLGPLVTSAW